MLAPVWPFFGTHLFAGNTFRTSLQCEVQEGVQPESIGFLTSVLFETPVTRWHGRLHRWFWHLRVRLHKWPQQKGRAVEQGKTCDWREKYGRIRDYCSKMKTLTTCWPKQNTVVCTWHGGHGRAFRKPFSFSFIPQGVFGTSVCSLTNTESWQMAGQVCEQFFKGKLHVCLQFGHSLKWHRWGSRSLWWQSEGFLNEPLSFSR